MIQTILASEVNRFWHCIRPAAEAAMPPYVNEDVATIIRILKALVSGDLQAHLILGEVDNQAELVGVVITEISIDPISQSRNLTVYALYAYTKISIAIWSELKSFLQSYGKSQGCGNILALTNDKAVINLMKYFGASELWHLMIMPTEDTNVRSEREVMVQEIEVLGPYDQQLLPGLALSANG